jgi:hypothetical protein
VAPLDGVGVGGGVVGVVDGDGVRAGMAERLLQQEII